MKLTTIKSLVAAALCAVGLSSFAAEPEAVQLWEGGPFWAEANLGLGATLPNKATKDVYLVSPDNVVGAWTTDASGKVGGWKTIDSFNSATTVGGLGDFNGDGADDVLLKKGNYYGAWLVKGVDSLTWAYYGSVGAEWLTEPLGLK